MNKKKIHKNRKNNGVVKQAAMLIIVMALLISTIVAIILVKNKKHITQVSSDDYMTTQNELDEQNSLVVDIEENKIDENIIKENNESNITTNNATNQNNTKTNNSGTTKYKLEVNCTANVVNVYEKDENGDYTKCVKVMLCSVGSATPHSGTYSLKKYGGASWRWRALFGNVYGQYATQITGNILFHSVPYTKPNNSDLEYWEYDKLGTSASMGCVRLTVQNAKWIWDNCAAGTKVRFYDDSNPGPLGKPTEAKISWNEECRSWDPTDPDANNPWKSYNNKQENNKPQESKPVMENKVQESESVQEENKIQESKPVQEENKTQEGTSNQESNKIQEDSNEKNNQIQESNTTKPKENKIQGSNTERKK